MIVKTIAVVSDSKDDWKAYKVNLQVKFLEGTERGFARTYKNTEHSVKFFYDDFAIQYIFIPNTEKGIDYLRGYILEGFEKATDWLIIEKDLEKWLNVRITGKL